MKKKNRTDEINQHDKEKIGMLKLIAETKSYRNFLDNNTGVNLDVLKKLTGAKFAIEDKNYFAKSKSELLTENKKRHLKEDESDNDLKTSKIVMLKVDPTMKDVLLRSLVYYITASSTYANKDRYPKQDLMAMLKKLKILLKDPSWKPLDV